MNDTNSLASCVIEVKIAVEIIRQKKKHNFFFFILFTSKIRSVSFALSAGRRIVQITYNYPI